MSWPYLRTAIVFRWLLRGVSPRKELLKYMKLFLFNRSMFIKLFIHNIHSGRNKTDANNLLMKLEIHASTKRTAFSSFPWKQTSSYVKKSKFAVESWQPWKVVQVIITWNRKTTWNLKLSNLLNTLSISTSAEGKSWDRHCCCLVIQRSLLSSQIKYLFILHFPAPVIWF